jgi:branched-chain amino acid transport system substrate-binding protein
MLSTYYDQMRMPCPHGQGKERQEGLHIYQDDEFGLEVLRGAEAGLKTINMELVEKTSFKRGATDFSSQVARMKAPVATWWCWAPSSARPSAPSPNRARPASTRFPGLRGRLHRPDPQARRQGHGRPVRHHDRPEPYLDEASQPLRFWANKYKTKFNEDPTVFSAYGYMSS